MIKKAPPWAPTNAKLLAFKTLSLSHLEYAASAWNPNSRKDISDIEQYQDQAERFIAGIKGRIGVEYAKSRLGLVLLDKRRRDQRLSLLMHNLSKEEHHSSLSESYNEPTYDDEITSTWNSSYLPN